MTSPQRFLANDRNLVREATIVASSVLPVSNSVLALPRARTGTGSATLTGSYTGEAEALYEVEIVDTEVDSPLISAPVFAGAGSGTLTNISSTGSAQTYTVELNVAGTDEVAASVVIEGVVIRARASGAAGNAVSITVDQSGLVFADSSYSLLYDIAAGQGSPTSGLVGAGWDWDCAVLGSDNIIPAGAHRVAFGDDTGSVYLSYKAYADGRWQYHFVPAITNAVTRGTPIKFVAGGRTVTVSDGATTEVYSDVETVYDLLGALKSSSTLIDVVGVVANDRTPTGQAAKELLLRTDAHAEPSSGRGSQYATGVTSVTVSGSALTELVTATCYAVNSRGSPLAHLGGELWQVEGSLSGTVGAATTGVPFAADDGAWSFTIPRKLPPGYGAPKGRFSVSAIAYASRAQGDPDPPPLCVVAMALGPNAVDQTITLKYTARPSGDCACDKLPIPSLDASCLGNYVEGGSTMDYSAENQARLQALYEWAAGIVRDRSTPAAEYPTQAPFISDPMSEDNYIAQSLFEVVSDWETTLKQINDLPEGSPSLRPAAESAWDARVAEFQADVEDINSEVASAASLANVIVDENLSAGDAVGIYTDRNGDRHAVLAWDGLERYGFVLGGVTAGGSPPATTTVYFDGEFEPSGGGLTPGARYFADKDTPGAWVDDSSLAIGGAPWSIAVSSTVLHIAVGTSTMSGNAVVNALLSDRYRAAMRAVLITGGISPLGKSDASAVESGDGCWRDWGGSYYWTVTGSDLGAYAPAFNNRVLYSSRLSSDGKAYFSTREFAFQVNVACPEALREGDTITLSIGDAGWPATYQVGDVLTLPVIGAGPLALSGGSDGDPAQSWYVTGSADGALAPYDYDPDAPAAYADGDLSFLLNPGGVPFAKGDKFTFSVEGGHYRWRKDGGAWQDGSPLPALSTTPTALDEGLSLAFGTGAAPSFSAGDTFAFRALQPWSTANVRSPLPAVWRWSGTTATLDLDLGSVDPITMVALLHTLPEGATITLEGAAADGSPWTADWSETLTWRPGSIWAAMIHSARYLRLSVANAGDGSLQWLWLGEPLATELTADVVLRRGYRISRADGGLIQSGRYLGKSVSGSVEWTEGALSEADVAALTEMLDWVKANDDEPILFVPQVTRTGEAALFARINSDDVDFPDVHGYQPAAEHERRHSATLPLAGVWQ